MTFKSLPIGGSRFHENGWKFFDAFLESSCIPSDRRIPSPFSQVLLPIRFDEANERGDRRRVLRIAARGYCRQGKPMSHLRVPFSRETVGCSQRRSLNVGGFFGRKRPLAEFKFSLLTFWQLTIYVMVELGYNVVEGTRGKASL